jgi:hypothetical protein
MQRKQIESSGFKILYEKFDNTHELVKVLSEREPNADYKRQGELTKDRLRESWHGVNKMEKAHELLYYGWNKEIEAFKKQIKVNSSNLNYKKKARIFADYVGSAPIVANAIMGIPTAMVGTNYKPKRNKVLNMLVDCGVSAHVETRQILEWGAKVVAIINRLEREGYRCRVEVMYNFGNSGGSTQQILRFKVKEESEPIDLQRFTFPMAHPAMFRAIGFQWEETLPGGRALSGKGSPLYTYSHSDRDKILEMINDSSSKLIYTNYRTDLEDVLRNEIGWRKEVQK